jgi:hypothetical protein
MGRREAKLKGDGGHRADRLGALLHAGPLLAGFAVKGRESFGLPGSPGKALFNFRNAGRNEAGSSSVGLSRPFNPLTCHLGAGTAGWQAGRITFVPSRRGLRRDNPAMNQGLAALPWNNTF